MTEAAKDSAKFRIVEAISETIKIIGIDIMRLFKDIFMKDADASEKRMKFSTAGLTSKEIKWIHFIAVLDLYVNSIVKTRESLHIYYMGYNDPSILENKLNEAKKRVFK